MAVKTASKKGGASGQTSGPGPANLKVETRALSALVPYENNPRVNDHAVEDMRRLIREFGFRIPMLVRGNEIVDGHLRYKAAAAEGVESVPVVDVGDLDEGRVRALRIAMNKSAEWAEWNPVLLAGEFDAIAEFGLDLGLTGFTDGAEVERIAKEAMKEGGSVEHEGANSGKSPSTASAFPKHHDADAGASANPHYVTVTFTMSEADRTSVVDFLKSYAKERGLPSPSEALVALVSETAKSS